MLCVITLSCFSRKSLQKSVGVLLREVTCAYLLGISKSKPKTVLGIEKKSKNTVRSRKG